MGKIVSAIDFSDCSINAFRHALSIAQRCKSELELVWVDKSSKELASDVSVNNAKARFKEMIDRHASELKEGALTYKILKGRIYREIAAEAKAINAMMVVSGTHGASGFDEFWIGSNANRIVAACDCPVITIRGGINIRRPLHKIVMPIDSTMETRQKVSFTSYLAKVHAAEVIILKLYSSKVAAIRRNVDLYASQVAKHFEQEGIRHQIDFLESNKLADATIEYARQVDANLISIMTEQETMASNLWMGPFPHQVVNHSPIPVLSIHSRSLMTISTS